MVCLFAAYPSFAQKVGVAVFGATPGGLAAAIQSAHSGVETILIDNENLDAVHLTSADKTYKIGIYAQFLQRVDSLQKNLNYKNNESLTPAYTAVVFKGWTDTIKNLTVLRKSTIKEIKKDGKSWEIEFTNGNEIKANVVVDATIGSLVSQKASVSASKLQPKQGIYSDKLYRTSVALVGPANVLSAHYLPISYLLAGNAENFLILGGNVPSTLVTGQGAGASAAYCAFFKTDTKDISVRKTQAELVTFKSQFIRFDDIDVLDSNAVSIQKVAVTGIIKGKEKGDQLLFIPDSTISTEEIRKPFREYYSRSQIWFLDNKADQLSLAQTLSLIKFVGSRAGELDKEVKNAWKTSLKLKGEFDLKRIVNRREFAVLVDTYLQPYIVAVDMQGNVTR